MNDTRASSNADFSPLLTCAQHDLLVQTATPLVKCALEETSRAVREIVASVTAQVENFDLKRRNRRLHEEVAQVLCLAFENFVGIDVQNPFAAACFERSVARTAEVVVPVTLDHGRACFTGELDRAIGRAGVVNNDFIDNVREAVETYRKDVGFVFDDHARAEQWHIGCATNCARAYGSVLRCKAVEVFFLNCEPVEAVALERCMSVVMDKRTVADEQLSTVCNQTDTEVVVFRAADLEAFVETVDPVECTLANCEAETNKTLRLGRLTLVVVLPLLCKLAQRRHVSVCVVGVFDDLRAGNHVRTRTRCSNTCICKWRDQVIEPA